MKIRGATITNNQRMGFQKKEIAISITEMLIDNRINKGLTFISKFIEFEHKIKH